MLQEAFDRFQQASDKLQKRYEDLQAQVYELQKQLQEKELDAKKREKLALLGETAAALAHEVRNPLGSLKLFLSLLAQDVSDRPQCLTLVEEMKKSISSLDHVVSNILHFAKNPVAPKGIANIHSILQEELKIVLQTSGSEIRTMLYLEGNPYVEGNEHDLRRVFHNLFLNALQAMQGAGTVEVHTYNQDEQCLLIKIQDSGPGIGSNIKDKLFDPFVTTKNEGTGLGLAIAKQIINQHQGIIQAENNNGALFTITLPRMRDKET